MKKNDGSILVCPHCSKVRASSQVTRRAGWGAAHAAVCCRCTSRTTASCSTSRSSTRSSWPTPQIPRSRQLLHTPLAAPLPSHPLSLPPSLPPHYLTGRSRSCCCSARKEQPEAAGNCWCNAVAVGNAVTDAQAAPAAAQEKHAYAEKTPRMLLQECGCMQQRLLS